ncbi:extracellular solute-binding protein [Paenibacillus sp. KQZ6P-2]|uniref:Extracellular solute-binding protein n=1 Tax=Paenibacillus mangrovi TaxID=2931978 RepID=A0A9X1WR14_9BACL|nr:extracellular solute-binding protein [Paenibacillus mangrovi]MCJ8012088.1 extracellular solute-binding protein [Paenibacillus mangrovi]
MKRWFYLVLATIVTLAGCSIPGISHSPGISGHSPGPMAGSGSSLGALSFSIVLSTGSNPYAIKLEDIHEDKWIKQLEALTNTDLQITMIPLKDVDKRLPVLLTGDDFPDVIQTVGGASSASMAGTVEAGLFMPLDDLLRTYAPRLLQRIPKEAWQETSYDGHIYGIPAWLDNPSRRGTYIRTDLLKKTGLPVPKTVDQFLDVLRAFKKLGVENPYQMRENFKYADVIFGAYDVLGYQFERKNGEIVPKFFEEKRMMEALSVYKTMLEEGLIAKNFATVGMNEYARNIYAGKVGIWTANAAGLLDFRSKVIDSVPGAKVDIIPSPEGPGGTKGYGLYSSVINSYFINKQVSKETAIGILKFFDWMLSDEAELFFSFGIPGDTYTVTDGVIHYPFPKTQDQQDEQGFRELLWLTHDLTINRERTKLLPGGGDVLDAIDSTLTGEGLGNIVFVPELEVFSVYPELAPNNPNQPPLFIVDHMVRMIYGKEPISDWPKVIREYRDRGGDAIILEATQRYNAHEGVLVLPNR